MARRASFPRFFAGQAHGVAGGESAFGRRFGSGFVVFPQSAGRVAAPLADDPAQAEESRRHERQREEAEQHAAPADGAIPDGLPGGARVDEAGDALARRQSGDDAPGGGTAGGGAEKRVGVGAVFLSTLSVARHCRAAVTSKLIPIATKQPPKQAMPSALPRSGTPRCNTACDGSAGFTQQTGVGRARIFSRSFARAA